MNSKKWRHKKSISTQSFLAVDCFFRSIYHSSHIFIGRWRLSAKQAGMLVNRSLASGEASPNCSGMPGSKERDDLVVGQKIQVFDHLSGASSRGSLKCWT